MKFYVPEIGDDIVLTKDWEFSLFPESRNNDLASFNGHYLWNGLNSAGEHVSGWVDSNTVPHIRQPDFNVVYPSQEDFRLTGIKPAFGRVQYDLDAYTEARRKAEQNTPEYVKYWADRDKWIEDCRANYKPILQITLQKGTLLKVDRIYVRKGSSDFSSITFYAKGLGEIMVYTGWAWHNQKLKKKKSLRFWAKLVDCNTIEFESAVKE